MSEANCTPASGSEISDRQAWDEVKAFSRGKVDHWTSEDWSDFYHGITDALKKIALRHRAIKKEK